MYVVTSLVSCVLGELVSVRLLFILTEKAGLKHRTEAQHRSADPVSTGANLEQESIRGPDLPYQAGSKM